MAFLYSGWQAISVEGTDNSGTRRTGTLYARLRLAYSISSTDTQYTVNIGVAGVEAYSTSSYRQYFNVSLVKSSNTFAKKNYYYNYSGTSHTSTYHRSTTASLQIGTASNAASFTQLDDYSSYTYTINKTTSSLATTLRLWGSISLSGGANGTLTFGSESSPSSVSITVPALASYSVTYNANGGSGAPASQTKWYGISLTLSSTQPTRTGYTFKGWATTSGGSVAYSPGGTYTANAGVTLYAVWQIITYRVTYNANGGTNGSVTYQDKNYGASITLNGNPTRSGWTLIGWHTSASSTYASYAVGETYSANASITLYAIWRKTLTLSYNLNGGSGTAPSSSSADIYNATTSASFIVTTTTPTRSGWTFLGWSTSSTATSASYSGGNSITISSNTTLYAIWRKTLTLAYNANGGTGAPGSQLNYIYNSDTSSSFTISSTKPTRANYTFQGWATSASGSAEYQPGESITISADTPLYAVWKAVHNKPTISSLNVIRCNSTGSEDDDGTYAKVVLNWGGATYAGVAYTPASITIYSRERGTSSWTSVKNITALSGTSGSVSEVVGGSYSSSLVYDFRVVITSTTNSETVTAEATSIMTTAYYTIDINPDGSAIAFFGSAPDNKQGFFVYDDIVMVLDDAGTSGTDDYNLAQALTAIGWSDLI